MKPKDFQTLNTRRKEKLLFAYKIGQHLKKIRQEKGVSQEKLSMDAGYYHTYVNKIENGNYSPSMHTIWRLVHALGISLSEFFKNFVIVCAAVLSNFSHWFKG